jgi:hypothetical protein
LIKPRRLCEPRSKPRQDRRWNPCENGQHREGRVALRPVETAELDANGSR